MGEIEYRNVLVVGVGALGSHVVQFIRNFERTRIIAVDFDRVEQKNLLSQFHSKPSLGKNKVVALKDAVAFLWGLKIAGVPHKLTEDNVDEILGPATLVIDCLDNAESRRVVQNFVGSTEGVVTCLHGALDAAGSFGRIGWDDSFAIDQEPGEGMATCEDGAFLPFIAVVASYMAYSAQQFLATGRKLGWSVHPGGAVRT